MTFSHSCSQPCREPKAQVNSRPVRPRNSDVDPLEISCFPSQLCDQGLERALAGILSREAQAAEERANFDSGSTVTHGVVPSNKSLFPLWSEPASVFFSVTKPDISISTYVRRLVKYAQCSPAAFVVALVYMDRLSQVDFKLSTSYYNLNRLLITSLCLAAKFLDDRCYSNAHYARVGGISTVAEMNRLEINFAQLMNFRLYVTYSDYSLKEQMLIAALAPSSPQSFYSCSTPSLALPSPTHSYGASLDTSPMTSSPNSESQYHVKENAHRSHPASAPVCHRQVSPVAVNHCQMNSNGYRSTPVARTHYDQNTTSDMRRASSGDIERTLTRAATPVSATGSTSFFENSTLASSSNTSHGYQRDSSLRRPSYSQLQSGAQMYSYGNTFHGVSNGDGVAQQGGRVSTDTAGYRVSLPSANNSQFVERPSTLNYEHQPYHYQDTQSANAAFNHFLNVHSGSMPVDGTGVFNMPGSRVFAGHRAANTGIGFSGAAYLSRSKSPTGAAAHAPFIVSAVGGYNPRHLVRSANM